MIVTLLDGRFSWRLVANGKKTIFKTIDD